MGRTGTQSQFPGGIAKLTKPDSFVEHKGRHFEYHWLLDYKFLCPLASIVWTKKKKKKKKVNSSKLAELKKKEVKLKDEKHNNT